jgi:hypothetical protein
MSDEYDAKRKLNNFLHELTSSYYAGKVMEWIESKVEIRNPYGWH